MTDSPQRALSGKCWRCGVNPVRIIRKSPAGVKMGFCGKECFHKWALGISS